MFLSSTRSVTGISERAFDVKTGLWRTLWTNPIVHWPKVKQVVVWGNRLSLMRESGDNSRMDRGTTYDYFELDRQSGKILFGPIPYLVGAKLIQNGIQRPFGFASLLRRSKDPKMLFEVYGSYYCDPNRPTVKHPIPTNMDFEAVSTLDGAFLYSTQVKRQGKTYAKTFYVSKLSPRGIGPATRIGVGVGYTGLCWPSYGGLADLKENGRITLYSILADGKLRSVGEVDAGGITDWHPDPNRPRWFGWSAKEFVTLEIKGGAIKRTAVSGSPASPVSTGWMVRVNDTFATITRGGDLFRFQLDANNKPIEVKQGRAPSGTLWPIDTWRTVKPQ